MPLPLDLPGRPDERVVRQLVEAVLYEGLVVAGVTGDGAQLVFTWSDGAKRFRCSGMAGAFGRIRLSAGSVESEGRDGFWQPATLDELVASLPASVEDRRRLLDTFGIMVVPAPLGEFEHNAALHIVTADGQLVRILGLEDGPRAMALARELANASAP